MSVVNGKVVNLCSTICLSL